MPLEADLLNGVPWLQVIQSKSMAGLSTVQMVFAPGTDLMKARQMAHERLTEALRESQMHDAARASATVEILVTVTQRQRTTHFGIPISIGRS